MFSDNARSEVQCADPSEIVDQRDSSAHLVLRQIVAHTSEAASEAELCIAVSSPGIAGGSERASIASATPQRRRRGPSLSRRSGQKGNVYQPAHPGQWNPNAPAYGRIWLDVPGSLERKRKTVSLGLCVTKTVARQRLREYIEREGVNSKETFTTNTAPVTTFKQQSELWLDYLATRTRKPVKPATICGWRQALHAWILPNIGDKPVADVSNGVLRGLVAKMVAAGLSPKTIVNYSQVVKLVVASAVNDEGDQIYPRKWNHDFIGIPLVQKEKQHRPTVTETELREILTDVSERYRILFALLAGTGLRIGEALGLKGSDLSPDCHTIHVQRSVWRGQEQSPKTANAVRFVDVPEELAVVLRAYVKQGYLFSHLEGASVAVPQRFADIARHGEANRLPCLPSIPFDVAQKARRSLRLGTLLDGTCIERDWRHLLKAER